MAIRFPLKKIAAEKAEYIAYLQEYLCEPAIARFPYKTFYDKDPEVQRTREEVAVKRKEEQEREERTKAKSTQKKKSKLVSVTNSTKGKTKKSNDGEFVIYEQRINEIKKKIKETNSVTSEQKYQIEQLHHEIISHHTVFTSRQKGQIKRLLHNLQLFVENVEKENRCKHITDQIEILKTMTTEQGFFIMRKSIREKIKSDKNLTEQDKNFLKHNLNKTMPFEITRPIPKPVPPSSPEPPPPPPPPVREIKELVIKWSQIDFGNNIIRIRDNNGNLLLAPESNCKKSYNQIKEYLADRLPQIKLIKNHNGAWTLKEPNLLFEALKIIRRKETDDLLQEEQFKKALRAFSLMENYLKNEQNQELVLKRLMDKKQKFLNNLIKLQLREYKLVPAIEMIAHESSESVSEEDVFIFTIPYQHLYRYGHENCINIIYENINPARATIVCTVEKRYYSQALQSIYNFMNNENEKNKRSRLHLVLKLNNYVKNLHVVNHIEDMRMWTYYISR